MFECFMLTLPSAATSRCSGFSKTILLASTDGYTYLVPKFPSNRKSILDSASSTLCPQEVKSDPGHLIRAHTYKTDVINVMKEFFFLRLFFGLFAFNVTGIAEEMTGKGAEKEGMTRSK